MKIPKIEKTLENTGFSRVPLAETVRFELTCPLGQTHFEFSRRLLHTWFLLSVSASLVRPQPRMKSGFFEAIARKC